MNSSAAINGIRAQIFTTNKVAQTARTNTIVGQDLKVNTVSLKRRVGYGNEGKSVLEARKKLQDMTME